MSSPVQNSADPSTLEAPEKLHPDLPIFAIRQGDDCVLYTPGHSAIVEPEWAKALAEFWRRGDKNSSSTFAEFASGFAHLAASRAAAWARLLETPFQPECLTLYSSLECNSRCVYCHWSRHAELFPTSMGGESPVIHPEAVETASRLVAQSCARKGLPFTLVLHGGGEPTLHEALMRRIVGITRQAAANHGTAWHGHVATNGSLEEDQVVWLAENFSHIGLSCDGPPEIHDAQRPLLDGRLSSTLVERAARVLRDRGAPFTVRSTIMPQSVHRQLEIASYLITELGAREISFEPVYGTLHKGNGIFHAPDAPGFAGYFLAARRMAQKRGVELECSIVRPGDLHGPYCNVLRDVLHLMPSGTATPCFLPAQSGRDSPLAFKPRDATSPDSTSQAGRIEALRQMAGRIPQRCQTCLNIYHCTRECPDVCLLKDDLDRHEPGFRCRVAQLLAPPLIVEATRSAAGIASEIHSGPHFAAPTRLAVAERQACIGSETKPAKDLERLESNQQSTQEPHRSLPQPIWARRGFNHNEDQAWAELLERLAKPTSHKRLSVYLHTPFCDRRCAFCDCYSFAPRRQKDLLQERFVSALQRELKTWSQLRGIASQSITTVHFGGGTPSTLGGDLLGRIVHQLQASLGCLRETEWALEATSSALTGEHLKELRDLGFTRLHVGVQTLEDNLRGVIGRLEPSELVIQKLASSLEAGFIVSVDAVYGLPGQTAGTLLRTLSQLSEIGVHGFSLYQLQRSPRNHQFSKMIGSLSKGARSDHAMFATAEQYLRSRGYEKNHFAHYARKEDRNLYYRHAVRGEDLLALGPWSDGVFGDYHYRHTGFREYVNTRADGRPPLEGGVCETSGERRLRRVITQLMGGSIDARFLAEARSEHLLASWLEQGLLEPSPPAGSYSLTADGSWYLTRMIAELERTRNQAVPEAS